MVGFLTGFIEELRAAGIPVSMVEAVDAARAIEQVDLARRPALKAALGATMVKSARHLEAFDVAFEAYFSLLPATGATLEERDRADLATIAAAGETLDYKAVFGKVSGLYSHLRWDVPL